MCISSLITELLSSKFTNSHKQYWGYEPTAPSGSYRPVKGLLAFTRVNYFFKDAKKKSDWILCWLCFPSDQLLDWYMSDLCYTLLFFWALCCQPLLQECRDIGHLSEHKPLENKQNKAKRKAVFLEISLKSLGRFIYNNMNEPFKGHEQKHPSLTWIGALCNEITSYNLP